MAYWIKITYERNTYVIDLEQIAAFCQSSNHRLSFVLPDGMAIVVNAQTDSDAYQQILNFIKKRTGLFATGLKLQVSVRSP